MDGHAIAAEALSYAGLDRFTTEHGGPRPATVRAGETVDEAADPRTGAAPPRDPPDRPQRGATTRAMRP
jgi:hypothetical protein